MSKEQKDPPITLQLSRNVVGQICEGLHERMLVWRATEQYLEQGYSHISDRPITLTGIPKPLNIPL